MDRISIQKKKKSPMATCTDESACRGPEEEFLNQVEKLLFKQVASFSSCRDR